MISIFAYVASFCAALTVGIWQLLTLVWLTMYYVAEVIILSVTPEVLRSTQPLRGKTVLITGGAGGVGRHLVQRLAKRNATVIVWDLNETALENLKEHVLSTVHREIHTFVVDVSDREQVYKYATVVKTKILGGANLDVLINNAGIVCGQTFLDLPDYMIEKTFNVNILSYIWTVKAFLPDMLKTGRGHIVTMASLTGMLGTYKCCDYSATKHATIGFHESLRTELKMHGHHRIHMTLICPFFINTGMFDGCQPRHFRMLEADDVAKRIIQAIRYREPFVTMPNFSRYVLPLKNYLPDKLSWALIVRVVQGPQSMMGMRAFREVEGA